MTDGLYLQYISVGTALVRFAVFCVLQQDFVHVGAGVLKETVCAVEDDESDLAVAQHAQLVRLFHQTEFALGKCHLEGDKKPQHYCYRNHWQTRKARMGWLLALSLVLNTYFDLSELAFHTLTCQGPWIKISHFYQGVKISPSLGTG